jgi:hypothetical protein
MSYKTPIGLVLAMILVISITSAYAENIDPHQDNSQYAYGENAGWVNFEPNIAEVNVGATVSSSKLTGFIWAENIGWVNLSPASYGGIFNDGAGNLLGYAWGENVGWINFSPSYGGVTVDLDGNFNGWAWGENIGWLNFESADLYGHNIKVCKLTFEDLVNLIDDWLLTGDLDADLNGNNEVDFTDYSIFASYWLDYCPDDWQLKTIVP